MRAIARSSRSVSGFFARRAGAVVLAVAPLAATLAAPAESTPLDAYDELPDGTPRQLVESYHSALAVPGIAAMSAAERRHLLDVVTHRYKNRLVDRGAPSERARGTIARLSASQIARDFPLVVPQACAQHGLADGPCAPHRGYVRRARLLEEMLATRRLTLAELEVELIGAARPGLRD